MLAMMLAKVLEERPDLVRIARVVDDVLTEGEDARGVHLERVGARDPLVDLDELVLVKVLEDLRVQVEEVLEGLAADEDQVAVKGREDVEAGSRHRPGAGPAFAQSCIGISSIFNLSAHLASCRLPSRS